MNERFTAQSDDIPIAGHLLAADQKGMRPLLVLCHGAPSGAPPEPGDGGYPELAQRLFEQGYDAAWFNFRGTGESGGNIDFLGWTRDLQAVLDFLEKKGGFDSKQVCLVGFSAGAGTAIYVAARDDRVTGVVSCSCPADFSLFLDRDPRFIIEGYRQIGAIRDSDFPPSLEDWFRGLLEITPVEHIGQISPKPLLLVHGTDDQTVPVAHASRLYKAAGKPKELALLAGLGHRLRRDEGFINTLIAWLDEKTGRIARKRD